MFNCIFLSPFGTHTHHRPSAARVLCSPSNDGLKWSHVGTLHLHSDPTANLIAGFAGAGSGIAFALGTLAVTLWLRWRRLRKVATQRKSHRVGKEMAGAAAHESVHVTACYIVQLFWPCLMWCTAGDGDRACVVARDADRQRGLHQPRHQGEGLQMESNARPGQPIRRVACSRRSVRARRARCSAVSSTGQPSP